MKVFFVYAGKQGSNLECALSLHELAKKSGIESEVVLSLDNDRREKVQKIYPKARFCNFFSPTQVAKLRGELKGGLAFFTMISPKVAPLYFSLRGKKAFYFHATYDHSFERLGVKGRMLEMLQDAFIGDAGKVFATQHPLAWQIRYRLGKETGVLPHPPYSPIRREFFEEEKRVEGIPKEYFLDFGGIERFSKGTDVLLKAVEGTDVPLVLAGKREKVRAGNNVVHINRWVSDAELYSLVKNCSAVVLPYLVPSQFSGCLALAFRFKKPVVAPFSPAFEGLVEDGKTGWFFSQGDAGSLREKMREVQGAGFKFSAKAIGDKEAEMEQRTAQCIEKIVRDFEGK